MTINIHEATEHQRQIGTEKKILSSNKKTLNAQSKERILKAVREKGQVTYKGRPIRITSDFSTDYERPKSLVKGHANSKRTQMSAQATIPSKNLNQHR